MSFVNEYVADQDVKKYELEEVNRKYWKSDSRFDWTVDRERDIYLRWMKSGRGEYGQQQEFTFYWQGTLLGVRLSRDRGLELDGSEASIWKLHHLVLPGPLKVQREAILQDLKEALHTYKTDGIGSAAEVHSAFFEF